MFWSLLLLAAAVPGIPDTSDDVRLLLQDRDRMPDVEILAQLEKLAAAGDDSASILLSEALFGAALDVPRDEKRACDIFEKFRLKYSEAAHNYATCFYRKTGGRAHDYKRARAEYHRAIDLGWPDSSCALGNMLITGQGGAQDINGGLEYCLNGAKRGLAHAQTDYGSYFLTGEYVPKDAQKARLWLERAALQNHPNAAYLLAQIYKFGDGVDKDLKEAATWFEVAHDNGRPDAAYQLGMLSLAKLVVNVNGEQRFYGAYYDETLNWLQLAQNSDPNDEKRKSAGELIAAIEKLKASAGK